MSRARVIVVIGLALISILMLTLAVTSIWFPRMLGSERLWDLNTGSFIDVTYIAGAKVQTRNVGSGLEGLFQSTGSSQKENLVMVYRKSLLQPARGGRWMRIVSLNQKILNAKPELDANDKQRLLKLIYGQEDAELGRWYYQLIGGHAPEP